MGALGRRRCGRFFGMVHRLAKEAHGGPRPGKRAAPGEWGVSRGSVAPMCPAGGASGAARQQRRVGPPPRLRAAQRQRGGLPAWGAWGSSHGEGGRRESACQVLGNSNSPKRFGGSGAGPAAVQRAKRGVQAAAAPARRPRAARRPPGDGGEAGLAQGGRARVQVLQTRAHERPPVMCFNFSSRGRTRSSKRAHARVGKATRCGRDPGRGARWRHMPAGGPRGSGQQSRGVGPCIGYSTLHEALIGQHEGGTRRTQRPSLGWLRGSR